MTASYIVIRMAMGVDQAEQLSHELRGGTRLVAALGEVLAVRA